MLRKLFFLFFLVSFNSQAQETVNSEMLIDERLESWIETQVETSNIDLTVLIDLLTFYLEHPLNLNTVSDEALREFRLLSDLEITALRNHIKEFGFLSNRFEIQAIEGWTKHTVDRIGPFVKVGVEHERSTLSKDLLQRSGSHDMILRYTRVLNQESGYESPSNSDHSELLGNANRYYLRYKYTYKKNIRAGFTAEKDPGEPFLSREQKGFDFNSAHIQYRGKGLIKNLIVGDFSTQFAQGLTMWSGPSFGKSSRAMSIKFVPAGLKPYTSVDENKFMRGLGIRCGMGKFQLTVFGSHKKVDANIIVSDSISEGLEFSSLQQSGFHRTENERRNKHAVGERIFGGNIAWSSHNFRVGLTGFQSEYQGDFIPQLSLYNQFGLNSNHQGAFGLNYTLTQKGKHWFGEASRSNNGAWAMCQGLMVAVHPKLSFSAQIRRFAKDYQNSYASSFSENSRPVNEIGAYLGSEISFSRKVKLSLYRDQFYFPWLKYAVSSPSSGIEYLAQLGYKASKSSEIYIRFRQRNKVANGQSESVIPTVEDEVRNYFRIHATYAPSPNWKFKTRIEWSAYTLGNAIPEQGFLFFQDITFKKMNAPVTMTLRYALFDTDSYKARIYAYENDLLYTWSIPAYYANGSRFYIMFRWKMNRNIHLWLRYSVWNYNDKTTVGGGINEIEGNRKNEIRTQLRWRF